ncbi:MAG: YceD family protein [Lactobacillales bacterium]|jgi:uncharacterized protein|nr:YceD family protein [Lactobacillales bacterium]
MKYSILDLEKKQGDVIPIDESLDIKESLLARTNDVLDVLGKSRVTGTLVPSKTEYLLNFKATTEIVMPSSRSLEPVTFDFEIEVSEVMMTQDQYAAKDDTTPDEEIILIEEDHIDLVQAVADNVVLNLPLRILTPEEELSDEMPSGNGWVVLSEADLAAHEEEVKQDNNPFAALKGMFEDDKN